MNPRSNAKTQASLTSSYQEPSSHNKPKTQSLRKESTVSTAGSESLKSNSHFRIHVCQTITIGYLHRPEESVYSYSDSGSDQSDSSQSQASDLSFCFPPSDSNRLNLSVNTDVPISNIIHPAIDRSKKKRHTHFATNRSPTPHFTHSPQIPFSFDKIPDLEEFKNENILEKTNTKVKKTTPRTACSNTSRVSPKTVISKDSPAYGIMKHGKCKGIRKYKFRISEEVSHILEIF